MVVSRFRGVLAALLVAGVAARAAGEQPAAGGATGTISGTVVDRTSGEPIIEAGVEAVGSGRTARTDLDGRFSLRLPPGTYELRVFAPLYQGVRLQRVVVEPNEVTRLDTALAPARGAQLPAVEVVAQARKETEASQLVRRKTAAVVTDTMSAEAIAKSPGAAAADVVQRTPSVTVRDDKFVVVRGLGERYTSALLNDSRLPSPDPLKRVVPLDLFPSDFLESLGVVKTYSPDLPGDFSAGLVQLQLRDFPDRLTYTLGASTGFNTQATFRDYPTYRRPGLDYLTLGEGGRNPPHSLPGRPLSEVSDARRFSVARAFENVWTARTQEAPPDFGGTFAIGDTIGPFGVQLGGVYATEFDARGDELRRQFTNAGTSDDPDVRLRDAFRSNVGTFRSRIGGVLTTAWKPSPRHKLTLRSLVNRNAHDETTLEAGQTFNLGPGFTQRQTRLRYVEEELAYGQLAGQHDFGRLRTEWRTALARTTRDEPDTRHTTYQGPADGVLAFVEDSLGGVRLTNETRERLTDSMLDVIVPFRTRLPATDAWRDLPGRLQFGPAYAFRDRDFGQRRFRFVPSSRTQDLTLPPETLFAPTEIGLGGADLVETTLPEDTFHATHEIIGGYGLVELPIVRNRLRVIGGVRLEYSLIRLDTMVRNVDDVCGDPTAASCATRFRQRTLDALPAVNLVYSPRDDMNVRLAWSESVARPEFRELAPAEFPAPRGDRAKFGNPDLVQTEITSWDLRWEWFFSPLELVSVGVFHKRLSQPIEEVQVQRGADPAETWINAGDARITGVEIEGRKHFGFAHRALQPLSLLTNVTWAESEVEVPRQRVFGLTTLQTSTSRALQGQAPLIVNAALDWTSPGGFSARLLYFTADRVISSAGSNGLPDTFFERRDDLDVVVTVPLGRWLGFPLEAKFSADNVLNAPYVYTQGDEIQRRFTTGVELGFGLSYRR